MSNVKIALTVTLAVCISNPTFLNFFLNSFFYGVADFQFCGFVENVYEFVGDRGKYPTTSLFVCFKLAITLALKGAFLWGHLGDINAEFRISPHMPAMLQKFSILE